MRLLFTSLAAHGHTRPLLPLATDARAAGHEVDFATGPDMHPTLREAGFEPLTAGTSIHEAGARTARELFGTAPDDPGLTGEQLARLGAETFGRTLPRRFLTDLAPLLDRTAPDVVVHDSANSGAELAGIPALSHGLGPDTPAGFAEHERLLAEFSAELGLPAPEPGRAAPYLDIYPPSLRTAETRNQHRRFALRPAPQPGSAPPPRGLLHREPGRGLAYLTFGTGFGTAELLREAAAALARLPLRLLVATGPVSPAELGEQPDNVTVESWLPQAELLPHLDLIVHHGGSGTTLGALNAALPQLLLPRGADQFTNAEAISASGAGESLPPERFEAAAVTAAARRLLTDPAPREVAARIASEISAMPAPEEVVARLPELVELAE
ncbi:glycosyltransferase [Actinopolyspora saharensis]|uniref:UDP:flavonoid glycosyltransferase YjiC, YdhE family n=1 Tax=Actinopolyspora saharensis TaxID=995062 RepID=A0A1H1FUZ0_9ACTN|nr:glycosyltransferase [Actinopolyspora saharensis]SDR04812.1 UDP:flavonoid glycosyltransferase YjiC, YdhE family [Actinopolyspora saharensis]